MLQTGRREKRGLVTNEHLSLGRHLPGCLREVPSALTAQAKQKVLITVFIPELFSAIQTLSGLWDSSRNQVISIQR